MGGLVYHVLNRAVGRARLFGIGGWSRPFAFPDAHKPE